MKRILIIFLCISLLFIPSCTKKQVTSNEKLDILNMNYPYSFKDSSGYDITLYEEPKKIAVLFSSYAEIWTLAGGSVDITVEESVTRGFADDKAVIVDSESGHTSINTELLIASEPDFVIGTLDHEIQCKAIELCRENGIPAALFKVEEFSDYLNVLKIFTDILDNAENYKLYGLDQKEKINLLFNAIKDQNDNKTVLFIRSGSSARSCKAKTANENFVCKMLNELQTYNIAKNTPVLLDGLSIEEVLITNPDHIFISTMGDETAAKDYMDSLLKSEQWNSLDAVKEEHYYYLPKDLFHYKPNARWYDAYLYLTNIIYPELNLE